MCRRSCIVFFLFLLFVQSCFAENKSICPPSSCGTIRNISHPFRLVTDPSNCGHHSYTLYCENNSTILYLYSGKYYVKAINYNNLTIRAADVDVKEEDCSSLPRFHLTERNFTREDPYIPYYYFAGFRKWWISRSAVILRCTNPALVNSPINLDENGICANGKDHSFTRLYLGILSSEFVEDGCAIQQVTMMTTESDNYDGPDHYALREEYQNMSRTELHSKLLHGFELSWYSFYCPSCGAGICGLNIETKETWCYGFHSTADVCNMRRVFSQIGDSCTEYDSRYIGQFIIAVLRSIKGSISSIFSLIGLLQGAKSLCASPFVVGAFIYKWRRRHLSEYEIIEEFLQNNNFMPIRYSYSDIKKMTKNFEHKLGEGGFGSVYKGQLRSGHYAAVKMLGKSGSNGQDFVNEVATIGVIHHVNVVQLIGFCVEGYKRALVYDFMNNGSLDKYIFSREGSVPLSWTKLFDISVGIARGIEYLHHDCGMQILHFDIKPHNILLDENFVPKVSDFGLSKLSKTNQSIVSLTAARGTIGYMAPELFYRNIGNVSYKSDVYSFGMLLLEMAGKRKNLNALAKNSSQIYFPFWVHNQISNGNNIEIGCESEEENLIAKKMILVGLWCIQMQPNNRPSMKKVVEMLEGDLDSVEMPPKPLLYPEDSVSREEAEQSSTNSNDVTDSTSLVNSFNIEFGVA